MPSFNVLTFGEARRPKERFPGGNFKTQRDFLDIIVDNVSLFEEMKRRRLDLVSPFWFGTDIAQEVSANGIESAERLLLQRPADFQGDRRSFFVCPECADLGCGAVSAVVESGGDAFVWRDFGYENNWEGKVTKDDFTNVGPFVFDFVEYGKAFRDLISRLGR